MFVLYVYVPVVSEVEICSMLQALKEAGYSVTHLGKNDPTKKWSGSPEEAVSAILAGTDMTLSIFIRDAKRGLDVTVEIHRDPRRESSTISASMPEEASLLDLGKRLVTRIRSFVAILGRSGAGKDQKWQFLHLSDDCPKTLRERIG